MLLATGFAAAITESISMGSVGFTSTSADRDFFEAQRVVEEEAVRDDTDLECREVTELYRSKGSLAHYLTKWLPRSRRTETNGSRRSLRRSATYGLCPTKTSCAAR